MNRGFYAYSVVRMLGARIGTDVNCRGGSFNCNETVEHERQNRALVLDGAEVSGYVYLDAGFHTNGTVRLIGARIVATSCATAAATGVRRSIPEGMR